MDEAEKYKQRLEAIAEKRRLQEEQDKARREMEDEKLRLQQLKRKSLRDQWLMEGAPLSPTSLEALSPRSPVQVTQSQEMEKQTDKSQSKHQRLSEEQEKKDEMGYGQTDTVKVAEAGADLSSEMAHSVVQNGENNATRLETNENKASVKQSPHLDEAAVVLANGREDLEVKTDHSTSEENIQSATNGPIESAEGAVSMKLEPGLCVSEVEPGQVPNVHITEEEEEEGTLVMRAECVIITDEGDEEDVPEEVTCQGDAESRQSDKTPLPNPEAGGQGGEPVEEAAKTETAPETFTESERSVVTEVTTEAQPATGDENAESNIKENGDGETKADGQDKQLEDPASVPLQSPASDVEGTMVAPVPVYSEVPPSTIDAKLQAESEALAVPVGAQAVLKAQEPACLAGQFQEVPLADPQDNQRTEAGPGEQEPLLLEVKASNTKAEAAGANSAASADTQSPTRASQGEETSAPKHKTCQCCSVM